MLVSELMSLVFGLCLLAFELLALVFGWLSLVFGLCLLAFELLVLVFELSSV